MLVADYGSSGEDSSEEEVPQQQQITSSSTKTISSSTTTRSTLQLQPSSDEDEDEPSSSIGQFLPKPKKASKFPTEAELECGPIPPKKTYGDEEKPPAPSSFPNIVAKKVKGVVRIAAPSLKDFANDVTDDNCKSAKFVQSMIKKGSGLFAILPEPRGGNLSRDVPMSFLKTKAPEVSPIVKEQPTPMRPSTSSSSVEAATSSTSTSRPTLPRSLIPDSVKNLGKRPPPSKLDEIRAKYMKQEANVVIVSSGRAKPEETPPTKTKIKQDSDDSGDEDGSTPNFFSFDSGATEIDEETLEKLKLPMPDFSQLPKPSTSASRLQEEYEGDDDIEDDEASTSTQAVHQQDFMKYVQKKKGKREEINFIDVKQDDLKPDSTEWVKHLTDDSAVPVRRGKGLGGMQKRKHQITYLAVEAKAREQELQQQWAAGRANRRQTKMKYGF